MLCFYYLLHNFPLPKQGAFLSFRALGICLEQPRGYLGSLARFLAIRMFHLRTQADTVLRFPIPVASNPMAFARAIQVSWGMFLYKSRVVWFTTKMIPLLYENIPHGTCTKITYLPRSPFSGMQPNCIVYFRCQVEETPGALTQLVNTALTLKT